MATAVINPDGKTLQITGVAVGNAQISVFDFVGAPVKVSVSVGGSGNLLATTAPGSITIGIGGTPVIYAISGGTGPYTATSSNASVATTPGGNVTSLSITGVATGMANVVVRDAANATVSLTVNVDAVNALMTSAPSALTIASGITPTPYIIAGGTAPYTAISSNANVATTPGGNITALSITALAVGSAQVVVFDSTGKSVTVNVTVVGASGMALYTTAPTGGVTVGASGTELYTVGGGTPGYSASSSNTSVATANVVGSTLTIRGQAGGSATVTVRDGAGVTVTLPVTVGSANALFISAPTTLTIARGDTLTYTIGGGSAPYTATSSNVGVATTPSGNVTSLEIKGVAAGTAKISVLDSTGKVVSTDVTVTVTIPSPFFTTVASYSGCVEDGCVTIAAGVSPTYTVGGGTAPYFAVSSNVAFATANVALNVLNITGIKAGSAIVHVTDSVGAHKAISVTVTAAVAATKPLAVNPSKATAQVGDVLSFNISDGSPSYGVTSSATGIATVSPATVVANGGTFNATLLSAGSTTITITDAIGQTTKVDLVVGGPSASLRAYPSVLQVGEDYSSAMILGISGGTGPYSATTSDSVLSAVSTSGNTLRLNVGSQGTRCIAIGVPATQTYNITLTVADALLATTTSTLTIVDNGKGDGNDKCGAP